MAAPATKARPAPRRTAGAASAPARRVATPSRRARPAASRTATRSARGSAPAAKRRSRITPPGGMAMIPVHAVGGAAGAVGGMADSGLVLGITRGRRWILLLGLLLGGIVALNVWGLSMSASTTGSAAKIDDLERANTVLQAKIAKRSSSDRVQALAAGLGLDSPTPKAVRYLKSEGADAAAAARRLSSGQISVLAGLAIAPAFAEATLAPPELAPAPLDPAASEVAPALDPASTTPVPPAATPVPEPAPAPPPATDLDGGVTP